MKKIIKLLLASAIMLTGCASKVERFEEKEIATMQDEMNAAEFVNVMDDTVLFNQFLSTYYIISDENEANTTIDDDQKVYRAAYNYTLYLEAVYDMAYSRVSLELENIEFVSDMYIEYIAMLQSYTEAYVDNIEYYRTHTGYDEDYLNNELVAAITELEEFYTGMMIYYGATFGDQADA